MQWEVMAMPMTHIINTNTLGQFTITGIPRLLNIVLSVLLWLQQLQQPLAQLEPQWPV